MLLQVTLRPSTSAQRCVACHDDLDPAPWRCPGCGTAAHRDCARGLHRCPTIGCDRVARPRRPAPVDLPAPHGGGEVWFVPGALAFFSPVIGGFTFAAVDALLRSEAFALLVALAVALAGPPAMGHRLARWANERGVRDGRNHFVAALGYAIGFILCMLALLTIAVGLLTG